MATIHVVNAFTRSERGGNPAGVCLKAAGISEERMQRIAAAMGLSETAFVRPSSRKDADFRIDFFTPTNRIPLCGHATIAAFGLMASMDLVRRGTPYTQETTGDPLQIIAETERVFMQQKPPRRFDSAGGRGKVASALGVAVGSIGRLPCESEREFPIEVLDTGVPVLLIPVENLFILEHLQPDMEKIRLLENDNRHDNVDSLVLAFTTETKLAGSAAHTRMFAPAHGIPEEAATGMASGALACYLFRHGIVSDPSMEIFEQGYGMGRPSEIRARLSVGGKSILEVWVGGAATWVGSREIDA